MLRKLSRQNFACQADAESAIKMLSESWNYHQIKEIECRDKLVSKAAATPNQKKKKEGTIVNQISGRIERREEVIEVEKVKMGRFILATNILNPEEMSDSEILEEYKGQQSNERGFRFLKDQLFFTSSVFVKNPERVEAIAMVMGVCLLVYNLAQRKLRKELESAQKGVRNHII